MHQSYGPSEFQQSSRRSHLRCRGLFAISLFTLSRLQGLKHPSSVSSASAQYFPPGNPGHSVGASLNQLYGFREPHDPPSMEGFVEDFEKSAGPKNAHKIMQGFSSKKLPAFHTLAKEFLLFDHWHCALPG